ncbi:ABC transporter permease [Aquibacillus albus]|uniref:ABC-2 type transport system permease protein n=1 Tax=Aquibacillus albus TaxID=1168171 RepID=A0ABS2MZZ6_9BACI|nr:ABC transporter permease [Aquibacillus albus]MBM7571457.1 ABC-2 type transport system permease protein [Aquibacillus albus]
MFDSQTFFKDRLSSHLKETSRYLKYIFNGHLVVAMLFFVSALTYYYQQWLVEIPEDFPTAAIIGVLFGIVASYSPVRTLLKQPDLVFLLPAEHKMGRYFLYALFYSFIIQLYLILLTSAALGPLFFASYPNQSSKHYLLAMVLLVVIKIWNLVANWWMLKIRDVKTRGIDLTLRVILNIVIFYFFIKGELLLAAILTLVLFLFIAYDYFLSKQQAGIVWDLLVEKDRARMYTFYRIANMFTDVPHLKTQTKKRHWLVHLSIGNVPFKREKSFDYLYRITSIRGGDYLGMYVRLAVIGGLCIIYIPNFWMKIILSILFLYLSGFQLMTLWQHHRTVAWLDLYPLKLAWRKQAIIKWLMQLLIIQTVFFGLLFALIGNLGGLFVVLIGGCLFSYLFVYGYVMKRLT